MPVCLFWAERIKLLCTRRTAVMFGFARCVPRALAGVPAPRRAADVPLPARPRRRPRDHAEVAARPRRLAACRTAAVSHRTGAADARVPSVPHGAALLHTPCARETSDRDGDRARGRTGPQARLTSITFSAMLFSQNTCSAPRQRDIVMRYLRNHSAPGRCVATRRCGAGARRPRVAGRSGASTR